MVKEHVILQLHDTAGTKVLEVDISGKLTRKDYQRFNEAFEAASAGTQKPRLLLVLRDMKGWTPSAMWEDMKFDIKHFNDIERVAVVGDSRWEELITALYKPFTRAETRYFDLQDEAGARAWVAGN